ncbi:MAG: hypothetical protein ACJ735_14065 [Actinomycetes bacterium]
MNPRVVLSAAAAVAFTASGCGTGGAIAAHRPVAAPSPAATPSPTQRHRTTPPRPAQHDADTPSIPFGCKKPAPPSPRFATPEAAMRYLAAAWNRRDDVSLCHVTTADARGQLNGMHTEAINLRLNHCERQPSGDYQCFFDHDFPASRHKHGTGHSEFLVGPAKTPGWYMTVFERCD